MPPELLSTPVLTIIIQLATLAIIVGGGYKAFILLEAGQLQARKDLDEHTKHEEQATREFRTDLNNQRDRLVRLESQSDRVRR